MYSLQQVGRFRHVNDCPSGTSSASFLSTRRYSFHRRKAPSGNSQLVLNMDKAALPIKKFKKLMSESIRQKKPYSAVTVAVEQLTSERFEEDDLSGIPDLVEAIKLQATGPAEAARAIRKKLKYGNVHRQLRALTLLDGLIQNAGSRFQRTFADEMLLERLRVCGTADLSDPLVRDKCKVLFRQWAVEYKNVRGLEQIAGLYKVSCTPVLETELH